MINKDTLEKINRLLDEDKFELDVDAEMDILKQGYNWSKDFIKKCLREGKKYDGIELYPNIEDRHDRYYCIHKYSLLFSKLILICFVIKYDLVVIHISPLNRGSKEGKIYYNS